MHPITPRLALVVAAALVAFWVFMPARIFPMYSDASAPMMIAETLNTHGEADSHFYATAGSKAPPAAATPVTPAPPAADVERPSDLMLSPETDTTEDTADIQDPSPVEIYFDQTFSIRAPQHEYDFAALRRQCERTTWKTRHASSSGDVASSSSSAPGTRAAVYLQCDGIYLGLTSVISQVKSCFRMAIDSGTGVILPKIPLRDANNLLSYNQGNPQAERSFGDWFDERHLIETMATACPALDIISPANAETMGLRKGDDDRWWNIDVHAARFFRERDGYFWAGKPFGAFFDEQFAKAKAEHEKMAKEKAAKEKADQEKAAKEKAAKEKAEKEKEKEKSQPQAEPGSKPKAEGELERRDDSPRGATSSQSWKWEEGRSPVVVAMRADFELFNVANDPTGHDRHMWDDLGRALRFLLEPRTIVHQLLEQIGGGQGTTELAPYFAVHFRGEGDNMWASADEQIRLDLDALDRAWEMYGNDSALAGLAAASPGGEVKRPPVYLACGDEGSLKAFVEAGKKRGWEITSKYALTEAMTGTETHKAIEALPFDFQAIIDLGMLVHSYFFIGIMGSAFSYTTANLRDPLSRYRGSSFEVWDDGGARTHMFPNADRHGDTTMEKYACCL